MKWDARTKKKHTYATWCVCVCICGAYSWGENISQIQLYTDYAMFKLNGECICSCGHECTEAKMPILLSEGSALKAQRGRVDACGTSRMCPSACPLDREHVCALKGPALVFCTLARGHPALCSTERSAARVPCSSSVGTQLESKRPYQHAFGRTGCTRLPSGTVVERRGVGMG
jgi:hypothetical protein